MQGGIPNIIYGQYGDELKVSSNKGGITLGTRMVMPNGDEYVFAQCSSTATLAKGRLVTCAAIDWAETANVVTASTGAYTMAVTLGATAEVTHNEYEDGTLWVYKGSASGTNGSHGEWTIIKGNTPALASETTTISLYQSNPCSSALSAATVQIKQNPYKGVLLTAAATAQVGHIAGVTAASCAASQYLWLQKKGEGVCIAGSAIAVGELLIVSAASAGYCNRWTAGADTTTNSQVIGRANALVTTAGDYCLVDLALE